MIYICTTALNRPDLHSFVFSKNKSFFEMLDNFTWIINIDCIDKLNFTYEETKDNYIKCINKLMKKKSNIIILEKSNNPSFTKAVKNLANTCSNMMKKEDVLFWLEDDWGIVDNPIHFMEYMREDVVFHLYQKCKVENFYPMLRGYKFANIFFNLIKNIPDNVKDPEIYIKHRFPKIEYDIYLIKEDINDRLVDKMMYVTLTHNKNRGCKIHNITSKEISNKINNKDKMKMLVYNKLIFDDYGREYMENNNIIKNTKNTSSFYSSRRN